MIRPCWAISLALLFLSVMPVAAQDGRLAGVRDQTRTVAPTSPDSSDSYLGAGVQALLDYITNVPAEDGGIFTGVLVGGLVVLAPFVVPVALIDDGYNRRLQFSPYPYAHGVPGYQLPPPEIAKMRHDEALQEVVRSNWAVRLAVDEGNDFRGLNRAGLQFKLEHSSRWGINSNWNWLAERLPCGCLDEAVLGDTNVTFRFAQGENASMYTGLGVRTFADRRQTDWGFNFTYGGDWFPLEPLIVSGVFDAGTLGHASVIHARGSVGAIYHGWELFAGYDFYRIGTTNLQGPLVGVRWWF